MMILLDSLNPQQKEAVETLLGPVLVVAGAGSGKSRVVTSRIAYLIEKGVPPEKILGVTFTNKAAKEMQERVKKLTLFSPLISTFHSLGAKILRKSIHFLGWPADFIIYDEEDSLKIIKHSLQALQIKDKAITPKACRHFICYAKSKLITEEEAALTSYSTKEEALFAKVYQDYQQRMKAACALDFDDLLYLTVLLLKTQPKALEIWQSQFDYLLVDEYQDTNQAQYEICRFLVATHQNFFAVGDPDQMIYSWRGAKIETILNFKKDFPTAKVIQLEQNYRSTPEILQASNALIACNTHRLEKNLWSSLEPGKKIQFFSGIDEREEAFFIAETVYKLHKNEQIPFKEMAVFYRTNAQSRSFEDHLLSRKIPYHIVGGISFYQRKEIKDILSFLRMVASDADVLSLIRTINLPKRGIGEATLEKIRLFSLQNNLPIFLGLKAIFSEKTPLRLSQKQKEEISSYINLIETLREKTSLKKLVENIIQKSGYLTLLKQDAETYQDRKENLDELIAKAAEWDELEPESSLESFLEELSLKSSLDQVNDIKQSLSLMTMHNGKGLEFTAVFLAGLEEDLLPHVNSRDDFQAIEEERRLFYVGMTRAKKILFLTRAFYRYLFGTERTQRPSRFLKEIPSQYLEKCHFIK